jgi:hypothetical protein
VSKRSGAPRNKKFNLLLQGDIKAIQELFIDSHFTPFIFTSMAPATLSFVCRSAGWQQSDMLLVS